MDIASLKYKALRIKTDTEIRIKRAYLWCREHPQETLAIGGAIFSGVCYFGKVAIKSKQTKDLEDAKNLYCYDRSLGHYWKLRRELRNDEWLEIDRRKQNGERLSDILNSMCVLD